MTYVTTRSGCRIDLLQPDPSAVRLTDISAHLSDVNRWCGAALRPNSVTEHSLLVVEIMERDLGVRSPNALLAGLLHDGEEYVLGDIISPVKQLIGEALSPIRQRIQRAILQRYGLLTAAAAHRQVIKRADDIAAATEWRDLMPQDAERPAFLDRVPPATWINLRQRSGMAPDDWRQAFENSFNALNHARAVMAGQLGQVDAA